MLYSIKEENRAHSPPCICTVGIFLIHLYKEDKEHTMAKKYRIKDIATLAGVSTGTVDRVLHNRGEVSIESRRKIEKVLTEINYTHNEYIAGSENKKIFNILIILPENDTGDYWDSIARGIERGANTNTEVIVKTKFLFYDQFNMYSCRSVFADALNIKADSVIIGPSFYDETVLFANQLFLKNTPYVFVDTWVNNTKPLAFFGPPSFQSGLAQARLLDNVLTPGKDIALFQAKRIGDETSIQSLSRSYGFISYFQEKQPDIKIHTAVYDTTDTKESHKILDSFFEKHPNIGGTVVFDTKAHIISTYLKEKSIKDIKLIGYGTGKKNIEGLKNESIEFLISERPEYQGEQAIKTIIDYLLFNKTIEVENFTPIDILIKETIDFL